MKSRTKPCIFLDPTGNIQESHWLLNLRTGRHVKHRKFTPLPIPPHIIARLHELTDEDNQNQALDFCDHHGNPIEDASLAAPNIAAHNAKIAGVDEIGVNNSGLDQLVY